MMSDADDADDADATTILSLESKRLLAMVATMPAIKPQSLPAAVITAFQRDKLVTLPRLAIKTGIVADIAYPTTFNLTGANGVPMPILREMRDTLKKETRVEFELNGHKVVLIFYTTAATTISKAAINRVATWLTMIYNYKMINMSCVPKRLTCWFYMTTAKKGKGSKNGVLSAINANTAFTRTCVRDINEIVVYRKEEWFKVFIHETIHTFGLDFSAMNDSVLEACATRMRTVFGGINKANCAVNLYEAYTEFWAEITNILFIGCYSYKDGLSVSALNRRINAMISMEAAFGQQQMHKVLAFMGIQYSDLIGNAGSNAVGKYQEKTSILAYYIIKNILLNNVADFLSSLTPASPPKEYKAYLSYVDFNAGASGDPDKGNANINALCNFIEAHKESAALKVDGFVKTPTMRMTVWEWNT